MSRVVAVGIVGVILVLTGVLALSGGVSRFLASGPDSDGGQTAAWPPVSGKPYPDWELLSTSGELVRMSSFHGKPIVIELIGMQCPACQAMSGAHWRGPFGGIEPQKKIASLDESFQKHGDGIKLSDPRITYIQLLVYDLEGDSPPSLDEARRWEAHFGLDVRPNTHVLIANSEMLSGPTRKMIPGVHLVDKTMKLRVLSGNAPYSNLYTDLIPIIPRIIDEVSVPQAEVVAEQATKS